MITDKDTLEKMAKLYNSLQDMLQQSYRESMVPLRQSDYDAWYTEIDPMRPLTCYMGYWYQADIEHEKEYRFVKVHAHPKSWVSEWDKPFNENFLVNDTIVIESADNRYTQQYVKDHSNWNDGIQLFLDSEPCKRSYYYDDTYDRIKGYWDKKYA